MKLRPHQITKAKEIKVLLKVFNCAYLRGEVRSGKTLTVLEAAKNYKAVNVLFITKKKAISSIESDYKNFGYTYNLTVINYESLHKITDINFDLIIYDESHVLSGFPKPSKRNKLIKDKFYHIPCIWLTGTPAAETYSQYYHQFYISKFSPFNEYKNFYKWAHEFVNITKTRIGTHEVNNYKDANKKAIEKIIQPYTVTMTQEDAGFDVEIKEHILKIKTPNNIHALAKKLIKERAIEGKKGFIMAETPAKLQSKVHQIYNGTILLETAEGETIPHILSNFKADYIKQNFKGKKIAIMYYYKSELTILKNVFGDSITTDIDIFNDSDKNIALQQGSTEGMNVSKADALVYYNFHFSGKNFIQSRDRLTVKNRKNNDVYFIIETPGINESILKRLRDKKDFNLETFNKFLYDTETIH